MAAREIGPRSFSQVIEALLGELRGRWYSASMLKQAALTLERFVSFLRSKKVKDLRAVNESHVFAYARRLASSVSRATRKPYSIATQRTHLAHVQRLFRFLLKQGLILRDPTLDLVLPSWKKLPRVTINQAQSRRLFASPDQKTARGKRDLAVLELLYGAAIRVGECERLDLIDVDLSRGRVMVRNGKGRKDRVLPLVGRAKAAMDVYLKESRPKLAKNPAEASLFLTRRGDRVRVKALQYLVRANARAAGLDVPVTPHTLRHACATHLLEGGASVRHVQKLLGHAHIATTAIYAQVSPKALRAAISKAHPRERLRGRSVESS